ncbi:hypothetical protein ACTA71_000712 [Dictyostelium dimigraforme]
MKNSFRFGCNKFEFISIKDLHFGNIAINYRNDKIKAEDIKDIKFIKIITKLNEYEENEDYDLTPSTYSNDLISEVMKSRIPEDVFKILKKRSYKVPEILKEHHGVQFNRLENQLKQLIAQVNQLSSVNKRNVLAKIRLNIL